MNILEVCDRLPQSKIVREKNLNSKKLLKIKNIIKLSISSVKLPVFPMKLKLVDRIEYHTNHAQSCKSICIYFPELLFME